MKNQEIGHVPTLMYCEPRFNPLEITPAEVEHEPVAVVAVDWGPGERREALDLDAGAATLVVEDLGQRELQVLLALLRKPHDERSRDRHAGAQVLPRRVGPVRARPLLADHEGI